MPELQHRLSPKADPAGKSLTMIAFEALRRDIIACELAPSEKLRIQALAKKYGVGVTAIREALSRLVSDGLVQATDQKGFRVSPVSRSELQDLTETRIALECLALVKAMDLGDVAWESGILAAFHQLSRQANPDNNASLEGKQNWARLHQQFHESLLAACGSPWLLSLCNLLFEQSERYRNLSFDATAPNMRNAIDEHRKLMEAVIQRDRTRATTLLDTHFRITTKILLKAAETSGALGSAD